MRSLSDICFKISLVCYSMLFVINISCLPRPSLMFLSVDDLSFPTLTKGEVQDLYKQCQKASEEVAKAVCQGDEEKVEKSEMLEGNLLKQMERSQIIDEFRKKDCGEKGE